MNLMKSYRQQLCVFALTCISILPSSEVRANVRMPAIFGDHMVLQENSKLPVWGWAAPGEKVTVVFKNQTRTAVAAADGSWRVDLKPVDPTGDAGTLTVTGQNQLVFTDVLVGDVWVASGQSNMEFGLQRDSRGQDAIAQATDSELRLFFVPMAAALEPRTDIGPRGPASSLNGKWLVCSPQAMASNFAVHGFSAVGYYFAREIRKATGHPIGMIATYRGGTPAQAWTSVSGLKKDAILMHYAEEHQAIFDNFSNATAQYPVRQSEFKAALKQWTNEVWQPYSEAMSQWSNAVDTAAGQAVPPKPKLASAPPKAPAAPDGGPGAPGNLFNAMVAPLIPYAIKGVIWYQGESNGGSPAQGHEYATLFPRMISDWREKWAQGNFPFLFVQLPNINALARTPSQDTWPWVRDSQLKTLSLPNTGMAVTIDVGQAGELHPPDKLYVGQRLALAARHIAYGQRLVYSGPVYESMTIDGNKIRIKFHDLGGGLKIGTPPPTATGEVPPLPAELTGFGIAGADQKFVWAKAAIEGKSVVVSSDEIQAPVAVRYDWGQNPPGDLYNQEGLPASPFRTDNWPVPQ